MTSNVPSTARRGNHLDYRQEIRDLGPGETARLTIPYRGFADRVEVDEIRVIV